MATKTTSSKSSTTKSAPKSSVTIMSKTPKAQPSTVNGVASASSIAIANAKNARAAEVEAKNRAAGVKYASDPGYAPSTGTYTTNRGSTDGSSTTYKNGVLQGTYDSAGNFTAATPQQVATQQKQNNGTFSSSTRAIETDSQAIKRISAFGQPFVYKGQAYDASGKPSSAPSNMAERAISRISKFGQPFVYKGQAYDASGKPSSASNMAERAAAGAVNSGMTTGVVSGEVVSLTQGEAVPSFDFSKYDLTTSEGYIAATEAFKMNVADTLQAQGYRDAINLLGDLQRFSISSRDYTQNSAENAIKKAQASEEIALQKLQMAENQAKELADERIAELEAQKNAQKADFQMASIGIGGGRWSTLQTGQTSIDTEFAKLQQKVRSEEVANLANIGIAKSEATNYYAGVIADIKINSNKQIADLIDSGYKTERDIALKFADNTTQANQMRAQAKLETTKMVLDAQQNREKMIMDARNQYTQFSLDFQKTLTQLPEGQKMSVMMPDGSIMTGVGSKSGSYQYDDATDSAFNTMTGEKTDLSLPKEQSKVFLGGLQGVITGYGSGRNPAGLDIQFSGLDKAQIPAMTNGTIAKAGFEEGWGNTVIVQKEDGSAIRFSHLKEINVKPGQTVNKNTILGIQGNTGNVQGKTGIHVDITAYNPDKTPKSPQDTYKLLSADGKLPAYLQSFVDNPRSLAGLTKTDANKVTQSLAEQGVDMRKFGNEVFRSKVLDTKEVDKVSQLMAIRGRINSMEELDKKVNTGLFDTPFYEARALMDSSDQKVVDYVNLRSVSGKNLADYIRSISGGAVTDEEANRLQKNVPSVLTSDVTFGENLKLYKQEFDNVIRGKLKEYQFQDENQMRDMLGLPPIPNPITVK